MGVQGCGKGTQARLLKEALDLVHISVGDILRWHIQSRTKLGARIKRIMAEGQLVHSSPSELVRIFVERFARKEWPGRLLPSLYYDPRSLETDPTKRASLHAKCVVIDGQKAFISSANFTEAAQTRNIEVGVLVHSVALATRLAEHFQKLAMTGVLKPIPI
jgi:phosphatidylserine/phosphatidylglycerophosphate/cardiolipin synthase-like enzyme